MVINVPTIDGKIEQCIVYDYKSFPYAEILGTTTVRKHKETYYNIPCAFDIETTNVNGEKPYAFMYQWQFCFDKIVCFGRTWEEYVVYISKLHEVLELSEYKKLVVYVHNLDFEFQFLRSFFIFTKVFARKERKPLKACANGIEYRCSYYLSNMSLSKFCENTPGVRFYKLKDIYDYNKIRTPKTPLTNDELAYCYCDVYGLCECIRHKLEEDTIASIPLTSTGYVRRDFRSAVQKNKKNRQRFIDTALDEELYTIMREAFRGGNTHANAWYSGQILENLDSYDVSSSYPGAMLLDKYPMTKFIKENPTRLKKYLSPGNAFIGRFRFVGVKHKLPYGIPYIDVAHCRALSGSVKDNGRILAADDIIITLTDIDYKIIIDTYDIDKIYCKDLYVSKYGYLPAEIREMTKIYFESKSKLKNVEGMEYEYTKSKNKLNSAYGMMVCNIVDGDIVIGKAKESIHKKPTKTGWDTEKSNVKEKLEKYYKNRNSFLSYQHGVWVTANARKRLQDMINIVGNDVVYIDTDSIKCLSGHKNDFAKMNKFIIDKINHAPIPPHIKVDGTDFYMGTWDYEGSYNKFITHGSKKYCYEHTVYDKEKKMYIDKIVTTVSGLGKEEGSAEISKKGITDFRIGKVFKDSGRLTAYYNDDTEIHTITINGDTFITGSNVALIPTTYILGISDEYEELLKNRN